MARFQVQDETKVKANPTYRAIAKQSRTKGIGDAERIALENIRSRNKDKGTPVTLKEARAILARRVKKGASVGGQKKGIAVLTRTVDGETVTRERQVGRANGYLGVKKRLRNRPDTD